VGVVEDDGFLLPSLVFRGESHHLIFFVAVGADYFFECGPDCEPCYKKRATTLHAEEKQ
jgi:hypothetical protein